MPLTEDVPSLPVPAASAPTAAATTKPRQSPGRKRSASSRVVGASPEELDSIKELIHFDHVYYKQEDGSSAGTADVVMEDASTTVAAVTALAAPSHTPVSVTAPVSPASVIEVEDTVVVIDDCPSPVPGSPNSVPLNLDFTCAESSDAQGLPQEALSLSPQVFKMAASPSAHSTETGYESAVSPLSDCSFREDSLFDDSPPWEDPLSELFPALV